ncbi:hypothetical protein [Desulfosporosinus sp. OT]|uniref:hypothetical protein n=1 Tax=Desulfosporosinus sp. OT TaxID=913865 RepID=UPI000223A8DB|nr:hypothetical protein [Desulfosporosinus sp. OT]EGW39795.1 hypothetical protein DOT_2011 [Desulfosporosinus sp. OT]
MSKGDDFSKFDIPKFNISEFDVSKILKDSETITQIKFPNIMQNIDHEKIMAPVIKANQEKVERDKAVLSTLEQLVSLMESKPEVINQINTLIQNSTIQNMQSNYDNSVGYQYVTNNTGLSTEEYTQLMNDMKELFDVLSEERSTESKEVLDDLDNELKRPEPRKGIIKASLSYLQNFIKDVIADPTKTIIKEQFIEFAKAKAPIIQEGINHIFSNFSS